MTALLFFLFPFSSNDNFLWFLDRVGCAQNGKKQRCRAVTIAFGLGAS